MKRRTKIGFVGIAGLLLVFVCGSLWLEHRSYRKKLPTYQGKTVDHWFYGEQHHCGLKTTFDSAKVAFREMGTNCLPFLLHNLKKRETGVGNWYTTLFPSLPVWLRSRLRPPQGAGYIKRVTLLHLSFLQDKLKPVAADLMEIRPAIRDANSRRHAFWLVLPFARESEAQEPIREFLRSALSDSESDIQLEAAIALAEVDSTVTNGLPVLLNAVTNGDLVASQNVPAQRDQQRAFDALRKVAPWLSEPRDQSHGARGRKPSIE